MVDIPTTGEGLNEPSQKEISAAVGYILGFLLGNFVQRAKLRKFIYSTLKPEEKKVFRVVHK